MLSKAQLIFYYVSLFTIQEVMEDINNEPFQTLFYLILKTSFERGNISTL